MTIGGGGPVLVTGADGFIGSHLVERLVEAGASVRALCCYNSNSSYGWLDELDRDRFDAVDTRLGDIRDPTFVDACVAGCDVVLHLAALISIPYSYEAPAAFVETNVMGTLHVLEACRRRGVERLVHTSTSEVYGTPHQIPILETHPLQAQSPYAATKVGADMLAYSYACSFGVPVTLLRPFNTYGPRQSARAVVRVVLGQLVAGAPELRVGSLEPRRDFTFVSDTVDAFVAAARTAVDPGTVIQLGTGTAVSVAELIELAATVTQHRPEIVVEQDRVRPELGEVMVLQADPGRAHELLGWTPSTSLVDGLRYTAEWLRTLGDSRPELYQR